MYVMLPQFVSIFYWDDLSVIVLVRKRILNGVARCMHLKHEASTKFLFLFNLSLKNFYLEVSKVSELSRTIV